MSFESSGLPVTGCAPDTTQSLDPSATGCSRRDGSSPGPSRQLGGPGTGGRRDGARRRHRLIGRWGIERGRGGGRRMVAPRSIHVEVSSQFGAELGQHTLTGEREQGIGAERLYHLIRDHQRIFFGPGTRRVTQHAKLKRQMVAMSAKIGIHATSIGGELFAVLWCGRQKALFRGGPDSQDALLAIVFQRDVAHNLREFAGGGAE